MPYIPFGEDQLSDPLPTIEEAVRIADEAARRSPRSAGQTFTVIGTSGITAYTTTSCGPEEEDHDHEPVEGTVEREGGVFFAICSCGESLTDSGPEDEDGQPSWEVAL